LNNSAKTYRRLLETKCEKNKEQRGKKKTLEKEGSSEAQGQAARSNKQRRSQLLFLFFVFCLKEKDSDCTGRRVAREKGQRAQVVFVACPVRTLFLSFLFLDVPFFDSFFWEKSKPKQA
jgi:hypothetical protein